MEKQGFLGTIGWIKGNLLTSSDIGEKYDNDTFYPGAPNIPDSAGPVPIAIPGEVTGRAIDENNILGPASYYTFTTQYSFVPNESNSVQGIQITFKLLKNYSGDEYRLLVGYPNNGYRIAHAFRFHSASGKYKMIFQYAKGSMSESDPVVEIGNWYTYRAYRDIETNKAITMEILQGSNLVYFNKFSYSSVISEPRMKYIFLPQTQTNLKREDWCQVDLSGNKTFLW